MVKKFYKHPEIVPSYRDKCSLCIVQLLPFLTGCWWVVGDYRETWSIVTGNSDRHVTSWTPATYVSCMRCLLLVLVKLENHCHKSCQIARRVDKQGVRPSVSNQARVEKLVTGSKSPVNNGQEAGYTRRSPNNGPSVINTNTNTET